MQETIVLFLPKPRDTFSVGQSPWLINPSDKEGQIKD